MGQVNLPSNIIDRIKRIENELAQVRKRAGLGNASISSGDLTIQNGGTLRILNSSGVEVARIGNLGVIGGETVWGLQAKRPDGSEALVVYGTASGSATYTAIKDRNGTIIFSDDGVSGHGIATPHMTMTPPQVSGSSGLIAAFWPRTTNGTFTTVQDCYPVALQPRLRVYAVGSVDAGGTAGELKALVNGTQIGSTMTIPANGSVGLDGTFSLPGWGSTLNYGDEFHFELQIRRTAGTGNVYANTYAFYGNQS